MGEADVELAAMAALSTAADSLASSPVAKAKKLGDDDDDDQGSEAKLGAYSGDDVPH